MAYIKIALLFLWGVALTPAQWLSVKFNWPLQRRIPVLFHRIGLKILGVKVTACGQPDQRRPLLICSNHVSWLDISVLTSLCSVVFVSKAEVNAWPIFGGLARLQRTVFIDRTRKTATRTASADIAARLTTGDAVVLFPEGTTSDGNRVLPFRSSLLGAARAAILLAPFAQGEGALTVQPVAIRYSGKNGLPIGRGGQVHTAWYGDMDLVPHLIDLVRIGAIEVEVHFGAARVYPASADRKQIAAELERDVRALRAQSMGKDAISVPKSVHSG